MQPADLLKRRQEACERLYEKMLRTLIGYEPCRGLRIEDAKFISEMARTHAFEAMRETDAKA